MEETSSLPQSSSSDDSSTTRSPRSTLIMRSLSLPYSIEEYAKEIRLLEDRMLFASNNNNHMVRAGNNKMRRSMSTIDKHALDGENSVETLRLQQSR